MWVLYFYHISFIHWGQIIYKLQQWSLFVLVIMAQSDCVTVAVLLLSQRPIVFSDGDRKARMLAPLRSRCFRG